MTFQQLVTKYNLPKKHFFKYLQIRSYIYSRIKAYSKPQHSTLEQITLNHMKDRGMVSLFYKTLLAGLKEGSQSYLSAWKRDLQVDITVEEWEHACLSSQTQSNNTRCRILQYKWMMRTYITPVKLHRINPNIPDNCTKCKDEIGTLFHCMWECRELQMFWKEVLGVVCEMTGENIPLFIAYIS